MLVPNQVQKKQDTLLLIYQRFFFRNYLLNFHCASQFIINDKAGVRNDANVYAVRRQTAELNLVSINSTKSFIGGYI